MTFLDFFVIGAALQADVQYQPHSDIQTDQRRQSVTDKWKWSSGIRAHSCRHTDIQKALQGDDTSHSAADDLSRQILCPEAHTDTFCGYQQKKQDDHRTADKTVFLSRYGKNKVRLVFGNEISIVDRSYRFVSGKTLSDQFSGGDGCPGIVLLFNVI